MKKITLTTISTLLALSAGVLYADVITGEPHNQDRLFVGATTHLDKPWEDGNELHILPYETAHWHVDGTIAPTKINFLASNNHVALRSGTNAKIDWKDNLAVVENSNTGIAYIDVMMYGTGGMTIINNRPVNFNSGNAGELLFQKDNSNLTGGITVEKGFVTPGHSKAFGNNVVTLKNNAGISFSDRSKQSGQWLTLTNDFVIDQAGSFKTHVDAQATLAGVVSGSGTLTIGSEENRLGTLFFTGENTFDGVIDVVRGKVNIGDGGTTGSFNNVSKITLDHAKSSLLFNRSNDFEVASDISGVGVVEQVGTGTTTLTGTNTFTGGLNINAGSVAVADASNMGSGKINVAGGDLRFTNNLSSNLQMEFSNNGSVSVDATKVATLTGALSGDTLAKKGAGTLNVSNFSSLNTLDAQAGTLNAVVSSNANIANIKSSAEFEKTGTGTLNLTGTGTISSGGELKVTEGAFNVATGANLSTSGKITGTVNVQGELKSSTGSTTEKAVFGNGSTLVADGGNFGTINFGTSATDKITVDFFSNSTTVSSIFTNAADIYFDFTNLGELNKTGGTMYLFSGFDATGVDFSNYSVSFSHDGSGLGGDATGIYFSWQAYDPLTAIWIGSQTNIWDVNTTQNWENSVSHEGAKFNQWDGVIFNDSATNTNVVISEKVTPASLEVNSTKNYTFSGEGEISGTTSLVKKGTSELTISTVNTYEGGTQIEGGTVTVKNMNALGSGKITSSDTGLLKIDASGTFGTQLALANSEKLNVAITPSNTVVVENANLAAGSIFAKSGTGLLKIQGSNVLSGTFNLNEGDAQFDALSGTLNGTINVAEGSTLNVTGAFKTALAGTLNLDGGNVEVSVAGSNTTGFNFNGTLIGSGNISFTSTDSYVGHFGANSKIALDKNSVIDIKNNTFYMNGGADFTDNYSTLNIEKGARFDFYQNNRAEFGGLTGLGTITASQENSNQGRAGNTLVLGKGTTATDVYNFGGTISAGTPYKNQGQNADSNWAAWTQISLVKTGEGTQIISGDNFAASTTIESGTLQFGDGTTDGRILGAKIENNGKLVMKNNYDQQIVGSISGTGDLVKEGTGTLTLNSKNTYTGKTIIKEGTLKIESSSIKEAVTIMPYGDSITAGSGGSYGSYRGYLADLLINSGNQSTTSFVGQHGDGNLPAGYQYHSGVGGDRIEWQIDGGQFHESRFDVRMEKQPDVILFHMGVNDLNNRVGVEQTISNTMEFIREVKASSPNTEFLLATIVPAHSPTAPNYAQWNHNNIEQFNAWVRDFCADPSKYGAEFADMNINLVEMSVKETADGSPTLGFPTLDKYTMGDSLHPNNTGYSYMASQWYAALMENYGADETEALSSASAVEISAGATLDVNDKVATAKSLSGAGNVTLGTALIESGDATLGKGALIVTPDAGTVADFSGVISGTGDFLMKGQGIQILSGKNTYTGFTFVNEGTLRITGSVQSSDFLVSQNGTIDGTGTIDSIVLISGKLAMGGEHGALTFTKEVVLANDAIFEINIGEDGLSDFIELLGDAQLKMDSTTKISVINADTNAYDGKTYKIFEGKAISPLFDAEGLYKFSVDEIDYVLSQTGILAIGTSIPEPSTYAAIFGALALAFVSYRRRKK